MKNKISLRNVVFILFIFIASVIAIRLNAKPNIYLGMIFALIGVLFMGFFSNQLVGAGLGMATIGLGVFIRERFPDIVKLKGDKLASFLLEKEGYEIFLYDYFIILLLLAASIGFLGGRVGKIIAEDRGPGFTVNKISYMAMFVAIGVIINTARVGNISFGGFPIILSGYILGPLPGFIVGAVTDLAAFIVRPSVNAFNPLYTLTSALTGLLPVLISGILGERYPKYSFIKVLIGIMVGQLLTTVILAPIFTTILYGKYSFWYLALNALIKQAVSVPVYAFLSISVIDRISKVVNVKEAFNRSLE